MTTHLVITGMTCGMCRHHVQKALEEVPGVDGADVNLEATLATVRHDGSATTGALIEAVDEAGYGATVAAA